MTRQKTTRAVLIAACCLCLPAVTAAQQTINFDMLSCPGPSGQAVTTQFASVGVSPFANPICLAASLVGGSNPNNLFPLLAVPSPPITWDYTVAAYPAGVNFTTIQSLDVGNNGLRLECFSGAGATGASLGFADAAPGGMLPGGQGQFAPLTVNSAGIRSCRVSQLNNSNPDDGYAIDNLMYPVELQSFSVE